MGMEDKGYPSYSTQSRIPPVQEPYLHRHLIEGGELPRQTTTSRLPPSLAMEYNLCEGFLLPLEPTSVLSMSFPQSHIPWTSEGRSMDPSDPAGLYLGPNEAVVSSGAVSSPFTIIGAEFGGVNAQEIIDARALAASKSHSEAERRRRERINAHLTKLRSLLPSTTKTDKASLLAEVIRHVKELKRQTTEIAEESQVPTESDELTVDTACDEQGRFIIRVSLCCADRPELLPDLIKALKSLRLKAVKAEITTLGGRVRNSLAIHTTKEDNNEHQQSILVIREALKAIMERTSSLLEASGGGAKRQRTSCLSSSLTNSSL
ncbi:transcription factor bHLH30-like [Wolffia australiana]